MSYAFSSYFSKWVAFSYSCLGVFELELLLDEGLCCNYAFVLYYFVLRQHLPMHPLVCLKT